jgi:hypothetical protein
MGTIPFQDPHTKAKAKATVGSHQGRVGIGGEGVEERMEEMGVKY